MVVVVVAGGGGGKKKHASVRDKLTPGKTKISYDLIWKKVYLIFFQSRYVIVIFT